jgi:hypothetical protein
MEQPHAELRFEDRDALADVSGGGPDLLRGRREAAAAA